MAGRPLRQAQAIVRQPETRVRFSSPYEAEVFVDTVRAYGFPAYQKGSHAVAYAPRSELHFAKMAAEGHASTSQGDPMARMRHKAVRIPPAERARVSRHIRSLVREGYSPRYAAEKSYHSR